MEIRQVQYFVAVAEERNFTRAAQRLTMTQPALSRAIRALERDLGAPLLDRTPQGVALTPVGEVMLDEGRALLARAADLTARVRRAAERYDTVTVASAGCDALLLDRLVRSYNDTAPPCPARATVGTPEDQLERVRSGRADLALCRADPRDTGLAGVVVRHEPCQILVSTRHRLAGKDAVSVADLAEETFIRWTGVGTPLADPDLWPAGPPGRPGPEVSDGLQMLAVVRLGQACALGIPQQRGSEPEGTVTIPVTDLPPVPLRLVWSRDRDAVDIRPFVRHARASFRSGPE
ncbi:LysR family transcriptional regulator [Streptomyces acidiscabies]|uniref:LysR family transcriptional regulator n=3 Tax=Streptomyces acidiscabies TaxID=42234 RepID=A0AAP6BEX4_9ACTN|nr:LysR family transcriptional regulator [Streptomyces acidiscabies]MBP5941909.1 LysR family transcriptional regulator [Streptomyces sp. LBUM 1476]MBZ3913357.1 LysR family transcriptional regulator [Streptomyces acidiscabies]MDX2963217.1 LysR family transcriptional regulator [Streptomyces acidiscabies]MDX3024332.1 LysR family transcriptional regulator [Streptomyces acidiscabies]MDX3795270.1 LysR family transcriptional regulator [Streptomyces acidiscabies]